MIELKTIDGNAVLNTKNKTPGEEPQKRAIAKRTSVNISHSSMLIHLS